MAKLKVFTVYDSKAEAYLQPFFMRSMGEALRGFQEVCNDPQSNLCKYPGDFTLFEIGSYDEESGRLESLKAFVSLGTAIEFKKSAPSAQEVLPLRGKHNEADLPWPPKEEPFLAGGGN